MENNFARSARFTNKAANTAATATVVTATTKAVEGGIGGYIKNNPGKSTLIVGAAIAGGTALFLGAKKLFGKKGDDKGAQEAPVDENNKENKDSKAEKPVETAKK